MLNHRPTIPPFQDRDVDVLKNRFQFTQEPKKIKRKRKAIIERKKKLIAKRMVVLQ